jgi:hypothetical protein
MPLFLRHCMHQGIARSGVPRTSRYRSCRLSMQKRRPLELQAARTTPDRQAMDVINRTIWNLYVFGKDTKVEGEIARSLGRQFSDAAARFGRAMLHDTTWGTGALSEQPEDNGVLGELYRAASADDVAASASDAPPQSWRWELTSEEAGCFYKGWVHACLHPNRDEAEGSLKVHHQLHARLADCLCYTLAGCLSLEGVQCWCGTEACHGRWRTRLRDGSASVCLQVLIAHGRVDTLRLLIQIGVNINDHMVAGHTFWRNDGLKVCIPLSPSPRS